MNQKLLVYLLPAVLVVFVTGAAISRFSAGTGRVPSPRGPSGMRAARYIGLSSCFYYPTGAALDAAGNVYVADAGTIRKVSPTGKVSLLAGDAEYLINADTLDLNGPGPTVRFDNPHGIAVDAAGTVYVVDTQNQLIRKISPAGVVSTLAGQWGSRGSVDGVGRTARFDGPTGVAVDAAGTVYVTDFNNNTIRKISPAGEVSTLAAARFDNPRGVAVDAAGRVYVCDTGNHRIRTVSPTGVVRTLAGNGPAVSEDRPPPPSSLGSVRTGERYNW